MLDGERPVRQLGWWWDYVGGLPAPSNGTHNGTTSGNPPCMGGHNCASASTEQRHAQLSNSDNWISIGWAGWIDGKNEGERYGTPNEK